VQQREAAEVVNRYAYLGAMCGRDGLRAADAKRTEAIESLHVLTLPRSFRGALTLMQIASGEWRWKVACASDRALLSIADR
jgi:hypothetical protein